jgi:hypothetical protein
MGTLASPRNLYYAFKKGYMIADLGKRILSNSFYYSSIGYYKAILSQYVNFANYLDIYKGTIQLSTIQASADIKPDVLGADFKQVAAKYGKPDFIFKENNLLVFVYKWKFNGLKTRCEIHFFSGKAFLVNYTYNQLDKGEREYIINTICKKYLGEYQNEVDLVKSKVSDRNNNVLFMNDYMMGLKVTYLSNCESDWYEAMTAGVNANKAHAEAKIRDGEKRFFNSI